MRIGLEPGEIARLGVELAVENHVFAAVTERLSERSIKVRLERVDEQRVLRSELGNAVERVELVKVSEILCVCLGIVLS